MSINLELTDTQADALRRLLEAVVTADLSELRRLAAVAEDEDEDEEERADSLYVAAQVLSGFAPNGHGAECALRDVLDALIRPRKRAA